jgi:hypothetical protein
MKWADFSAQSGSGTASMLALDPAAWFRGPAFFSAV